MYDEPEIIINGVDIGPGCAITIRTALIVFQDILLRDNQLGDPELTKNYLDRIKDIIMIMSKNES